MARPRTSLSGATVKKVRAPIARANARFARAHPGETNARQPVHTLYGGAHLFRYDSARRLGELALRSLETYAPDAAALARALELPDDATLHQRIYERVVEKLQREAVEDLRIDFEDGYGHRPADEEDGHAVSVGEEVAAGFREGTLPPFVGIRIKSFADETVDRAIRTLDLFFASYARHARGKVPPHFVVTLPKVTVPEQVAALAQLLAAVEKQHRLPKESLKLEIMVELPQAIIGADGSVPLRALVDAGQGRCVAAHFGTYDYTAACNITAAYQSMTHPACDFAKHVMQVSLAGTGVALSDGATTVMPVGPHKAEKGSSLSPSQLDENRRVVHAAWRTAYRNVRHSLAGGYYQGWDLHPAQLPVRYAAVYAFFLEALPAASARLRSFVDKAAQATLLGDVFDDAATGQGLLNFFLRGLSCGALTEDEARGAGLTLEELRTRSFLAILEGRRGSRAAR